MKESNKKKVSDTKKEENASSSPNYTNKSMMLAKTKENEYLYEL